VAILFKNNARSSLNGGIAPATTAITVADGSKFPAITGGDYFLMTIVGYDGNGNENAWEIVKVTARSVNVLTVVRAQEGTTALTWANGALCELRVTANSLNSSVNLYANPSAVTLTYSGGLLTGMTETLPGGTKTTTLTYTGGVLTSVVTVYMGVTRTETFAYSNGQLSSISVTEV
jgi:hypothetical protein